MTTSTVTISAQNQAFSPTHSPVISVPKNESEGWDLIQCFMHTIQNSGVLSTLSMKKLNEIALGYASLQDPTPRQQSILLHQLIYDVLYPSTKEELEDDQIDVLFDFEDEAKRFLGQLLPIGTDIEGYLSQLSVEKVVIERLILYRNFYQSQLGILNQSAETVNSKMIAKFEEIRKQFLEFSAKTEVLDENLRKRVEEVSKKMESLGRQYEEVRVKAQDAAGEFNGLQNTIKNSCRTFT